MRPPRQERADHTASTRRSTARPNPACADTGTLKAGGPGASSTRMGRRLAGAPAMHPGAVGGWRAAIGGGAGPDPEGKGEGGPEAAREASVCERARPQPGRPPQRQRQQPATGAHGAPNKRMRPPPPPSQRPCTAERPMTAARPCLPTGGEASLRRDASRQAPNGSDPLPSAQGVSRRACARL